MKKLFFLLALLLNGSAFSQGRSKIETTDSILLIQLTNEVSLSWNQNSSKIVRDKHYDFAQKTFPLNKNALIDLISDSIHTTAYSCGTDFPLTRGQLAFLLIREIKDLPNTGVTDIKYEIYHFTSFDCPYASIFFSEMYYNRHEIKEKVKKYLQ